MKKKFFLLLSLMSIVCCAYAVDYTCTFDTPEECEGWFFIQDGQPNKWMIGSESSYSGSQSIYLTHDGVHRGYVDSTSTCWAYKRITLESGSHSLRYQVAGKLNQSVKNCGFYIALIPVSNGLPANGSTSLSGNALSSAGWNQNGGNYWQEWSVSSFITDFERDCYLLLGWRNSENYKISLGGAFDNIKVSNAKDYSTKGLFTKGDYQYVLRKDSTYSICSYMGNSVDLTLPSEINGVAVTAIEAYAFLNQWTLKHVVIPSSYDSIAIGAFNGCPILEKVDVYGSNMATVNRLVFDNYPYIMVDDTAVYRQAWPTHADKIVLRALTEREVTITALSNQSALHKAIGEGNLRYVVKLKINGTINSYDIMIMRNKMVNLKFLDLTNARILDCAYEYATGYHSKADTLTEQSLFTIPLVSLMLPKTLQAIEVNAISYTTISSLGINSDVYRDEAFKTSSYLKNVIIGGAATSVPKGLFWNCSSLRLAVIDSVTTIRQNAFRNCTKLSSVIIGEGVKTIEQDAFNTCTTLVHVDLPNSLETIGKRAFLYSKLNEIYIPANVTSLGAFAFCSLSSSTTYSKAPYTSYMGNSENLYSGSYDNSTHNSYSPGLTVYSGGSLTSVKFAQKSRLKKIEGGTFIGNTYLKNLVLPDSIEIIEHDAFVNCGIDTLRMPNRLREIGRHAFWLCTNLKHIEFSKSLRTIPSMSFADCSSLDTLKIAVGQRTIEPHAFWNCTGLKTIKISSSVEKIGDYAFGNCKNVEKIYTYTLEPTSINQNTFSSWRTSNLFVPITSFYTYFYNTQWSQFLDLKEFDEPYEYFYLNNDYVLDNESGLVKGKPDADLYPGSSLIASASNTQELGILAANATSSGLSASILACQSALSADSLIIRIGTKKGKWSFFCFPMDIQFTQVSFPYRYVFREYNGQKRATDGVVNGYLNWQNVSSSDYLHHGQGYIFQGEETDSLVINIANPKFDCTDFGKAIQVYAAEHNYDMSWNYIGNPYPSYYDMDGLRDAGFITPVYVWNGQDYDVYLPGDDEYHFHPFEGFFVQNPNTTVTTLLWQEDNRETKLQADEKTHSAPSRRAVNNASGRYLINLTLSGGNYSDRTRVVFNDNATTAYDLGKDAIKMTGDAPVHLYTLDSEVHYSINERPFSSAYMSLGYDVDSAGMYTLTAQRMDTTLLLYDNELKVEVNLAEGPYTFYTPAGTNETRFAIVGTTQSNTTPTQLMILQGEYGDKVTVYDMMGNCLHEQVKLSDVQLPVGVYMLVGQEKTGKVLIR